MFVSMYIHVFVRMIIQIRGVGGGRGIEKYKVHAQCTYRGAAITSVTDVAFSCCTCEVVVYCDDVCCTGVNGVRGGGG